ncbi:hypothetical protein BDU57DRAFT_595411 [Ampelomyces quisqualis]|uniref:Rhodopsin domain-containing protein n=1 Tax=Ampelomyces quisqualis TaxID=50730 RepID=A0A6A5QN35_AMPQU|nr:hypothetical protein BDU57DRAFT_595411 [Ampelomyces quisqualis]
MHNGGRRFPSPRYIWKLTSFAARDKRLEEPIDPFNDTSLYRSPPDTLCIRRKGTPDLPWRCGRIQLRTPYCCISSIVKMSMPVSNVDPSLKTITPDGLPLAIIVLSTIFLGLSIITVSLRTYIRIKKGTFGLDDCFMVAGCAAYTIATGLAVYDVYIGLGRVNADLNEWQQAQSLKYYIIWILIYVLALATVKSSICITILRIASTKINLRITVYVLLFVTWASFFITFIGTLLYCHPVRAIWTPMLVITGQATCAPVKTFIVIGHCATGKVNTHTLRTCADFFSVPAVSTILTDMALVVVPGIILWNTQMKKQAKLQAFGLLSFASIASIITMVRIPYVNKFGGMTDLSFWVAHTMLCSNIETGIGCICSSVPSLRHFLRRDTSGSDSKGLSQRAGGMAKTISQQRSRKLGQKEDNWEELGDGSSDRSVVMLHPTGIQKEQTFELDVELRHLEREAQGAPARC